MMATKSKDEQAKEELEKGFSTHFQGAHAVKDSKMPVQTKVTANVKPLNIMGRFAKSANMMWGGEKKSGVVSPTKVTEDENDQQLHFKSDEIPVRSEREEVNYHSEYESDFDDCSDAETDFKPNGPNLKDKRGLQMPPLTEEDDEVFMPHSGHRSSEPSREQGLMTQSVALDSTLQTRVKDLSAQQKLKLLKLLEQDLQQDDSAVSLSAADEVQAVGHTGVPDQHALPAWNPTAANTSGDGGQVLDQADADVHPLFVDPVEHSLALRVRITTAWSPKAKFVSLGAIRLRVALAPGRAEGTGSASVDLLPLLGVKAFTGLAPLPAGSECVRTLPQLLGGSSGPTAARRPSSAYRGPASSVWKGPLSLDCPLELQFAGELSSEQLGCAGLEDLQLLVWNCETPPLNSSGARDVDVFVGGKCVWSGQLEEDGGGDDADSGNASLNWKGRQGELSPTLAIFPWRTVKATVSEPRHNNKNEPDRSVASSPAVPVQQQQKQRDVVAPVTPTRESRGDAGKPDWLAQQEQGHRVAGDLFSDNYALAPSPQQRRTGSRGTSRRHADQQEAPVANHSGTESHPFGSPKRRVSAAGKRVSSALAKSVEGEESVHDKDLPISQSDAATVGNTSNDAVAKRRAARRNRNHLLNEGNQGESDSAFGGGGFSPDRSATAKKMREAELKRSIDSMAFNDKFNLGRLSASKLPFQRPAGEEDDGDEGGDGGLLEITGTLDDSLDRPTTPVIFSGTAKSPAVSPKPLISSPQRRMGRSSSAALGLSGADGTARATRDSDRTAKIDLVQEKITSTIADLAKIMSAIPAGGISLGRADSNSTPRDSPPQSEAHTPLRAGKGLAALGPGAELLPVSSPQKPSGTGKVKVKTQAEVKPWHKKEQITSSAPKAAEPTTTVSSPHTLVLEIDSNWGDANYVGMNGVELYDRAGHIIQLNVAGGTGGGVRAITAFPRDLADLPQHKDDPRKVQNLLNGVNFTKNDLHSWLTPHIQLLKRAEGEGGASSSSAASLPYIAQVVMELEAGVLPAMCRLFNYNRSRTRNQRGVRHFKLIMDGVVQFEGYGFCIVCLFVTRSTFCPTMLIYVHIFSAI